MNAACQSYDVDTDTVLDPRGEPFDLAIGPAQAQAQSRNRTLCAVNRR